MQDHSERDGPHVPMVVRRVAPERIETARTVLGDHPDTRADEVWWELVDPAVAVDWPPAGVAVTRLEHSGVASVVRVQAGKRTADSAIARLISQLVPALRRTDARLVTAVDPAPATRRALLAAGFVALPQDPVDGTGSRQTGSELLVLQL